jgi:hypothetical protein
MPGGGVAYCSGVATGCRSGRQLSNPFCCLPARTRARTRAHTRTHARTHTRRTHHPAQLRRRLLPWPPGHGERLHLRVLQAPEPRLPDRLSPAPLSAEGVSRAALARRARAQGGGDEGGSCYTCCTCCTFCTGEGGGGELARDDRETAAADDTVSRLSSGRPAAVLARMPSPPSCLTCVSSTCVFVGPSRYLPALPCSPVCCWCWCWLCTRRHPIRRLSSAHTCRRLISRSGPATSSCTQCTTATTRSAYRTWAASHTAAPSSSARPRSASRPCSLACRRCTPRGWRCPRRRCRRRPTRSRGSRRRPSLGFRSRIAAGRATR